MWEQIVNFFSIKGFMPHGMCLLWKPSILWTQVISDGIITISYYSIPAALIYFVIKRHDLKFKWIFVLFGLFIICCGTTHLVAMIAFWEPIYGIQAIAKALTAIVSLLTAIVIWPLIPKALAIPSTQDLEQKNAHLKKTLHQLERSNKELDDFAYIASHDLKEPLRGIHNFSGFLMEDYKDKLDEQGLKQLQVLQTLTTRMENLITVLLEYSRVGRIDFALEECDLQQLVKEKLALLDDFIKENNVEIFFKTTLPTIVCDKYRIGEVFQNLITNAIKYNEATNKIITIDCDEEKDKFVFSIQDNGIGIAKEHFDDVFKIFKRLHGRDEYGGGSGAGMTIAKKIIERHGGDIWLKSGEGQGTTVFFSISKHLLNNI